MKGALVAYTPSACGVGSSSSSSSSSCSIDIRLGVALERDELSPSHDRWERVTFRNTPAAQLIVHNKQHKQLDDGLVKQNEILTEVAPPMINTLQQLGDGACHSNLEQEIQENERAKE
jgi:hypothetical protein